MILCFKKWFLGEIMRTVVVGPQFNPKWAVGIIVVALGWLMVAMGTYTVQSGSVGVLSLFGNYSENIKQPGLHFKIPGVQEVFIVDTKMQTANYQGEHDLPDEDGLINKPKIVVLDSKNLNIGIEITVQFSPDALRAKNILVRYGYNYFEKLINPNIRDIVRDVAGQYQAEDIAVKRSVIGDEIHKQLRKKFEAIPFILDDVQIRGIELPKIVRTKIEEVQLAKQEEQRLAMIEKQARKNQEIKSIEANTKLIEVTVQAQADAEKKKIEADAKAFQISIEAQAVAKANEEIAKSINSDIIQYEAIKKWSGHYPKMLVNDKSGMGIFMGMPNVE